MSNPVNVLPFRAKKEPKVTRKTMEGVADLGIAMAEDLKIALAALNKIASSNTDSPRDQGLRSIAVAALNRLSHYKTFSHR